MKPLRLFLVLCLSLFVISCASVSSVSVNNEFDPDTDFTLLRSYDWFPFPKENMEHGLIIMEIKTEMNTQMKIQGFKKVSANPDFLIALHGGIQSQLDYTEWNYLHNNYEKYAVKRKTDFGLYSDDTLIIDFIDPKTKKLFYRAIVTVYVSFEPSAEKRKKKINEAITKVLDNYSQARAQD